ncbi:MAG: hypothetical protein M0Z27_07490 [Thermaerobacter sp.]|nr:hypothetical protein [Thermaerobacter sp.]
MAPNFADDPKIPAELNRLDPAVRNDVERCLMAIQGHLRHALQVCRPNAPSLAAVLDALDEHVDALYLAVDQVWTMGPPGPAPEIDR